MKRIAATAALVLVVACGGRPSTLTSPSGGEPPILAIPAYDRDEWPTWVDADGARTRGPRC